MTPSRIVILVAAFLLLSWVSPAQAMLNPQLGRFMQQDPLGYVDGMNNFAYLAANPTNRTDLSGSTMTIVGQKTAKGEQFSNPVLQALGAMCPCVELSFQSIIAWPPGKAPGTPGVVPDIFSRVVAAEKTHDSESIFCDCTGSHAAGCRLVHDLLTGPNLNTIDMTREENGDERDLNVVVNGNGKVIFVDRNRIHWNPYYDGGNARSGPGNNYENTVTVLAHELQHSFDFNFGTTTAASTVQPPQGSTFTPLRWTTEMNAVAIQNQVYEELTGIAGTRNTYGGFPASPKWPAPKSSAPCDCQKARNELPWGADK